MHTGACCMLKEDTNSRSMCRRPMWLAGYVRRRTLACWCACSARCRWSVPVNSPAHNTQLQGCCAH
jgi:hypothetical protein